MEEPGSTVGGPPSGESGVADRKARLRGPMRALRRSVDDPATRSGRIVDELVRVVEDRRAAGRSVVRAHVFESIAGEPDTAGFRRWCGDEGIAVATPDDDVAAAWPDVVVVPGLAFTAAGERLGQGGGWYDRFLAGRTSTSLVVGLAFEVQIVDDLPTDAHDARMDCVVTEAGPRWAP